MLEALLALPHQLIITAQQSHIRVFSTPIDYSASLQAMQQYTTQRLNTPLADELWLLEHPSTYTLGVSQSKTAIAPHLQTVKSDRGGQITWHGPGQLVVYCLLDLHKRQWHSRDLVSASEQLIIASLAKYNVSTHSKAKAPGVYTPNGAKIASLGFKLKQHYSYHGFAVNIDCHLDGFERIDPCGCPGQTMTSLAIEQPAITKPKQSYRETLLALLPDYFRL